MVGYVSAATLVLLFCFPSFKDLVFNFLAFLLIYLAKRTFRQIYKIKSYSNYLFQGVVTIFFFSLLLPFDRDYRAIPGRQ